VLELIDFVCVVRILRLNSATGGVARENFRPVKRNYGKTFTAVETLFRRIIIIRLGWFVRPISCAVKSKTVNKFHVILRNKKYAENFNSKTIIVIKFIIE